MDITKVVKIQRFVKFYLCKKELKKYKSIDFNKETKKPFMNFLRFITNKDLKQIIHKLIFRLNRFSKGSITLTAKKFLTSFMVVYYTNDIINSKYNRHFTDNLIISWSKKLIDCMNNDIKNINDMNLLINIIKNYQVFCEKWLESDKNRQIEQMIINYVSGMNYIKKMEEKKVSPSKISRTKMEMSMILKNLKMMDKKFNIEHFKKNYLKIYETMQKGYINAINSISNNMHKAYYNMMVEGLYNKDIKYVYKNISELKERLVKVAPTKYKTSIGRKLESYDMMSILLKYKWTKELKDFVVFIVNSIIMFGSKNDEKSNFEWKQKIIKLLSNNFNENLPSIILMVNQKIDKLELDIKKYKKMINK